MYYNVEIIASEKNLLHLEQSVSSLIILKHLTYSQSNTEIHVITSFSIVTVLKEWTEPFLYEG